MKRCISISAIVAISAIHALAADSKGSASSTSDPNRRIDLKSAPLLESNISRPLRYHPDGSDFVIKNGTEFFNRPLYSANMAFRVDAADKPEFAFYQPGRGGNLRLGIRTAGQTKWLQTAEKITTRYRPGSMIYEVRDPLLGTGILQVTALPLADAGGLVVRAELDEASSTNTMLIAAFGGANGEKGSHNVDIGCDPIPVSEWFQLKPKYCIGSQFTFQDSSFLLKSKSGATEGYFSSGTELTLGDATNWEDPGSITLTETNSPTPIAVALTPLSPQYAAYIILKHLSSEDVPEKTAPDFASVFNAADQHRRAVAEKVIVDTPDPFINAAAPALCVAADAVWDEKAGSWMHGAVAWRMPLLGWRGDYIGDALGWHDRAVRFFNRWAARQNTNPIPDHIPAPEATANLARNETALHSNGDMSGTHYDMNLVYIDALFRHLLWTGDLDYARKMWPVIERHLAWERRLFRREFVATNDEKLPLYEGYCCIWASDDLAYNGGGAAHSSAYNYYHNLMAARVAKLIGQDPGPYEQEAQLIARGMKENLWLADRGWFAEWKDLLGLQLVHPNAAAWTFYTTVDSGVPSGQEAWQMSRFVDTQIPHFPIRGLNVPPGNSTISTTSWLPYTWSLNNVVMAETLHTSLAYWEANRAEDAYSLFKGAVLDSMYLGLCPGNVGMCTWYDGARRESQRDFGDGIGTMSRTLIEGLFGVKPDLLAGEVTVRPGFPADWNHASIRHPDFQFSFQRKELRDTYEFTSKFASPVRLKFEVAAWRDGVTGVKANGQSVPWQMDTNSVGTPRVLIELPAAETQNVIIEWRGDLPKQVQPIASIQAGATVTVVCSGKITAVSDPQHVLANIKIDGDKISGRAQGMAGYRTVFAQVHQGDLQWWEPLAFEIRPAQATANPIDWHKQLKANFETVDLKPYFNDPVTQIFHNEYRSPRSPFCSLAMPKQGIGSWCTPKVTFYVDDTGLRQTAAKNGGNIILPNGVPLATPGAADAKNIVYVSQWDNYPREISVSLAGKSSHAFLLMAGSTDAMKSRIENGELIVTYTDGTTAQLTLSNPTTWWPIDQDYQFDGFAYRQNIGYESAVPLPPRVDLATGQVRFPDGLKSKGHNIPGGSATVLDLPLDATKELKTLTVRAVANEVVIGLMSVTLQRP